MRKRVFNILVIELLLCISLFTAIGKVDAASIEIEKADAMSATPSIHHRLVSGSSFSGKRNGFCMNRYKNPPTLHVKMTAKNSFTAGYYVYVFNHGDATSSEKANIVAVQHAVWMISHNRYNNRLNPATSSTSEKAKDLWADAKKACSSYKAGCKPNPSITQKTAYNSKDKKSYVLTLKDGYYTSPTINIGINDFNLLPVYNKNKGFDKKYTFTLSGPNAADAKIYDKSNNNITKKATNVTSFIIKIPQAKVTGPVNLSVKLAATQKIYYIDKVTEYEPSSSRSKEQDVGTYDLTSVKPTLTLKASVVLAGITITKVDADDESKPLAGAQYKIFKNSDCTGEVTGFTDTYTTNADGEIHLTGLPAGTYYAKEVAPPPGYSVAKTSCLPTSTDGKTVAKFANKKNFVRVEKRDLLDSLINVDPSQSAEFGIYTNASCTKRAVYDGSSEYIPNQVAVNGVVTFEKIAATNPDDRSSYYYIKEETPPKGYALSSKQCQPVRVNNSVTFQDAEITPNKIQIQKRDGFTNFGINGVQIGLYSDSSCQNIEQAAVSTQNGYASFTVNCQEGQTCTKYVREIATPSGYIPKDGKGKIACVAVKAGESAGANERSVIITNLPYGNIKLLKLKAENNNPLSGVTFALLDENQKEVTDIDGNKVANQKTDDNGNLEFKNVLYGTYYIKEISNDGKYKILKEPIKFELNSNTDSVKLAARGSARYYLGDANGDKHINDDDLAAYQTYVADFDSTAGLAPELNYSMDINGDGNLTVDDLRKDMEVLDYYLKYVNSGNNDILSSAKNYNKYVDDFCNLAGSDNCSVDNISSIHSIYAVNKDELAAYDTEISGLSAVQAQWDQKNQTYQACMTEFNAACNTGEAEGNGEQQEPAAICSQGCGEAPGERPTEASVCEKYNILGDINKDCKVNSTDVSAISSAPVEKGDLNEDGVVDSKDIDILTRYVTFMESSKTSDIMYTIYNIIGNQNTLCNNSTDAGCSINNSELAAALSKVGKSGTVPSSISRSSVYVLNELITMKISKYEISKSKEIPGAKIVIRDSKNNKFLEYTSGTKPKEFNIPAGKYTLTEKVAPKGYKTVTTVISFEVNDDGTVKLTGAKSNMYEIKKGTDNHLLIYNDPIKTKNTTVNVPDTGSNVAIVSIVTGVVLVAGGGFLIYRKLI